MKPWTYIGAGAAPEVFGAPMHDLTDEEHTALLERLPAARGLYAHGEPEPAPEPTEETE